MVQVLVSVSLEKFSIAEEEAWAMQKLFIKKRKSIEKIGQVSEISKTMGTLMPA